jgi:kumamolisin
MASIRVKITGSEREALAGARIIGKADPDERIHVTVVVRRKAEIPPLGKASRVMDHDALVASHGASLTDLAAVRDFAMQYNLAS